MLILICVVYYIYIIVRYLNDINVKWIIDVIDSPHCDNLQVISLVGIIIII